ncbi:MAG TPA: sulfatase [Pseudolysinimonas sp.]|jgi:arylsulfatase A-like enzyme|nr:sulfatase [Pseudolysinimonas sp.]
MRAIVVMFDSLNRHMLPPYGDADAVAPNFARLASRAATFDNFYAGSLPCMPARREIHTGRYNFLHRSWGPLEPFDDSMPEMLTRAGVHTHLVSDHQHYWEDGGATYHNRYTTWEFFRGQEGDAWKGDVEALRAGSPGDLVSQDAVNRRYMPTEAEHSQTRTVDAGLEFLQTNVSADRWMLQIELFDPHEPFFVHQNYRDLYPGQDDDPGFDWPEYGKVVEPADQVDQARRAYRALVAMCDHSLGRVLDFMDAHAMWEDTMLIVNTDHGFLLGEHGWWAKMVQPWFGELVHLPMFCWDPRSGAAGTRRNDLAQTIDLAPTLLSFFGVEPGVDMLGRDLAAGSEPPAAALFGMHGGHVNVTDGRYVYMRASADVGNGPIEDFTLMPTHMRSRFGVDELAGWSPAPPFAFTKGLRTLRIPAPPNDRMNSWRHGTLLWDLENDPGQLSPITDDAVEQRMISLLLDLLRANDAPRSVFGRLGLPVDGDAGPEHLRAALDLDRALSTAAPLPEVDDLPARDLLEESVHRLLADPAARRVLARHIPWLVSTELIAASPWASIMGMARVGAVDGATLVAVATELAALGAGEPAP